MHGPAINLSLFQTATVWYYLASLCVSYTDLRLVIIMVTQVGHLCSWQVYPCQGQHLPKFPAAARVHFASGNWEGLSLTGAARPTAGGCLEQRNVQSYSPHLVSLGVKSLQLVQAGNYLHSIGAASLAGSEPLWVCLLFLCLSFLIGE